MRYISDKFMKDLQSGILLPVLERVKQDDTLMLAIRNNYVNIYYRGGNILKIEENNGSYTAFFDNQYDKNYSDIRVPCLQNTIPNQGVAQEWVNSFPVLKQIMDFFFSKHSRMEREFQQLVARVNNSSPISKSTEYFISDIEFADSGIGARFDMLAIRWLASQRGSSGNCKPVFIEMKYGDDALDGNAGLEKHLNSIMSFLADKDSVGFMASMAKQFCQLKHLGLLDFNLSEKIDMENFELSAEVPEVIFLLANHNPRSKRLRKALRKIEPLAKSDQIDLKFFVASFAGYGLHSSCMHNFDEFHRLVLDQLKSG